MGSHGRRVFGRYVFTAAPPAFGAAALMLVLLCMAPSGAHAQAVTGRVLDAATGEPVATAELALVGGNAQLVALTLSDSSGWFRLRIASAGVYRLEASGSSTRRSGAGSS